MRKSDVWLCDGVMVVSGVKAPLCLGLVGMVFVFAAVFLLPRGVCGWTGVRM